MLIMHRGIGKGLSVSARTFMKKVTLGIKAPREKMDQQVSSILHPIGVSVLNVAQSLTLSA